MKQRLVSRKCSCYCEWIHLLFLKFAYDFFPSQCWDCQIRPEAAPSSAHQSLKRAPISQLLVSYLSCWGNWKQTAKLGGGGGVLGGSLPYRYLWFHQYRCLSSSIYTNDSAVKSFRGQQHLVVQSSNFPRRAVFFGIEVSTNLSGTWQTVVLLMRWVINAWVNYVYPLALREHREVLTATGCLKGLLSVASVHTAGWTLSRGCCSPWGRCIISIYKWKL